MYERSAIVLEKYIDKILSFDKECNLKENYNKYTELIEEIEGYQIITEKEGKIIREFDNTVKEIENIQKEQEKLYKSNKKLEDERNNLFTDLGEDTRTLQRKFEKVETAINNNNEDLIGLRNDFVALLSDFAERQKERNKCEKARRLEEVNHIEYVKKNIEEFNKIDSKDCAAVKEFISSDKELIKEEIRAIMTKNGKNEKVGFNQDVIKLAIDIRLNISEKEAECYLLVYDRMKKILAELDNDTLNLDKYKKILKDISIKLDFLESQKQYIVAFLDYERMTAINGPKVHRKMMEEACEDFELDIVQINNLYELILKEISNKATKKAYKELYNKTYLKNIEDKEKNFEQEVNNIKINMGTLINSNYWRIEGVKNVYTAFHDEVSEKLDRDLSEYRIEEEPEREVEILKEKLDKNIEDKEEFDIFSDENDEIEEQEDYKENKNQEESEKEEDYEEEFDIFSNNKIKIEYESDNDEYEIQQDKEIEKNVEDEYSEEQEEIEDNIEDDMEDDEFDFLGKVYRNKIQEENNENQEDEDEEVDISEFDFNFDEDIEDNEEDIKDEEDNDDIEYDEYKDKDDVEQNEKFYNFEADEDIEDGDIEDEDEQNEEYYRKENNKNNYSLDNKDYMDYRYINKLNKKTMRKKEEIKQKAKNLNKNNFNNPQEKQLSSIFEKFFKDRKNGKN